MNVYLFNNDYYCEACTENIKQQIAQEARVKGLTVAQYAEYTLGPNGYPQGPYENGGGEADMPRHCGSGVACLEAHVCKGSEKIGKFLRNPLTDAGVMFVREQIDNAASPHNKEVTEIWANEYKDELEQTGCYEFLVTDSTTIKVRVRATSREHAKKKLEQMDFEKIERLCGLYMTDQSMTVKDT